MDQERLHERRARREAKRGVRRDHVGNRRPMPVVQTARRRSDRIDGQGHKVFSADDGGGQRRTDRLDAGIDERHDRVLPQDAGDLERNAVLCFIVEAAKPDVEKLQPGQAVTMQGRCDSGMVGQVKLSKCTVVK